MAHQRKYETADELREAVNQYFRKHIANNDFPDYAGMKLFIGIKTEAEVREYCKDPEFADVFNEAALRRESFLVRRMTKDNKLAQGCLNALKQKNNGGYTDRYVDNSERKLTIDLRGVGENAFK